MPPMTDAALFKVLKSSEYAVYEPARQHIRDVLATLPEAKATVRATQLLDRALVVFNDKDGRRVQQSIGITCLPAVARAGRSLPEKYDVLVSPWGAVEDVRLVLSKMTLARRNKMMRFHAFESEDALGRIVESLLDLAPSAVDAVFHLYRLGGRDPDAPLSWKALIRWEATVPAVAKALAAYRKERGAKPPAKRRR